MAYLCNVLLHSMKTIRFYFCITMLMVATAVWAVPAKRDTIKVKQADGTYVTIALHGDEWHHFTTTSDGYTVVKNHDGNYVYAQLSDGRLQPTAVVAHDVASRTVAERAFVSKTTKYLTAGMGKIQHEIRQQVSNRMRQQLTSRRVSAYDYNNFKGLIILVEFNDKKFSRTDINQVISDMVNKEGYTGFDNQRYTGSVCDYFSDNSAGKFKPQFDVVGPYTLDFSQYDPGMGYQQGEPGSEKVDPYASYRITKAAINAADADVDFSEYDGDGNEQVDLIFFIFAGNGSNYTGNDKGLWWPHRSILFDMDRYNYIYKDGVFLTDYASSTELSGFTLDPSTIKIDGIGTICHEFSHVLGLPDFYDTDYEMSGGLSNHPGEWSVMSGGSYLNDSRTPVGYSLYERYAVGFIDEPQVISEEGSYTLDPLYSSYTGYILNTPVDNEFFLFENRQTGSFKWDAYLPVSGMLVHRVDFTNQIVWSMSSEGNKVNVNPEHNYYEVVRASGAQISNGECIASNKDLFPGRNKVRTLNNNTSPANLKTWEGKENSLGLTNIRMANGVISFDVVNQDQSSVASVAVDDGEAVYYTLDGQKADKAMLRPGFYIVNKGGKTKKVVIR